MNEQKKKRTSTPYSVFFQNEKETTFISLNKESTYKNKQTKKKKKKRIPKISGDVLNVLKDPTYSF